MYLIKTEFTLKGDDCLEFVLSKVRNTNNSPDGITIEDEIEAYIETNHMNFFINDNKGFHCVSFIDNLVVIAFSWHDGTHKARKQMVDLAKDFYYYYTLGQSKPVVYTGVKNVMGNHSVEIAENTWQLVFD